MGHGMNFYDDKRKRAIRRNNHMARDLRSPDGKYRQRIVSTKKDKYPIQWEENEDTE